MNPWVVLESDDDECESTVLLFEDKQAAEFYLAEELIKAEYYGLTITNTDLVWQVTNDDGLATFSWTLFQPPVHTTDELKRLSEEGSWL